jgi:hypothetical protein
VTSVIIMNALWVAASAAVAVVLHAPLRLLDDRLAEVVREQPFEYAEAA